MGALGLLFFGAVSALFGDGEGASTERQPPQLPRGGRVVLPAYRVVAFYGAPQDVELGTLGIGGPAEAGRRLVQQARKYESRRRPVLPAFELIATVARREPGPDGQNRLRQKSAVIDRYLAAVRRIKGLLILDLQPGHADFLDEVKVLEPYLRQPDVGLALDSEWSVPSGVVPGEQIGSTDASNINAVSAYLSALIQRYELPQKVLLVHQFTDGMVTNDQAIAARPGVALVSNVDGFGTPPVKVATYGMLARQRVSLARGAGFFDGLKLFYREDIGLMSPDTVLSLHPRPDVVVYE
jgi:hypothetical protein